MKRLKSAIGLAVFTAVAFVVDPAVTADKKSNIVFILVDNIGWGDFGIYGGTTLTPRIDALASSAPVCASPTTTWRANAPLRARQS